MGVTVGIDLGTTFSAVAMLESNSPRLIRNEFERTLTPSAIWEAPSGEIYVGDQAYENAGSVRRFKRDMGTNVKLRLGERILKPEEASSLVLRKLIDDAARTMRDQIEAAVITVPANWKDGPRRATEVAGRLAGLRVERLINEPTAAAMAYGMRDDAEGKAIAVYDLGGGTFDVTLLRIHQRVFDIITSVGDDRLGGADFDLKIMKMILERLKQKSGYELPPPEAQDEKIRKSVRALESCCEKAKMELSFVNETVVSLPFFCFHCGEPVGIEEPISRSALESLIEDDIQRTVGKVEGALQRAELPRDSIDEVVLVGGSSRIPLVRRMVAEFFGKEPLTTAVNPDEAVALGAAIQAGIIAQEEVGQDSFVALDVLNSSLGVETATIANGQLVSGIFSPILKKDTKVPTAVQTKTYSTMADGQTSVEIVCWQGEAAFTQAEGMTRIAGPITVDGLPAKPAGEVKIDISMEMDVSEMLHLRYEVVGAQIQGVKAVPMSTGLHSADVLDSRKEAIDELWQRGKGGDATPSAGSPPPPVALDWRASPLASRYRSLIERAEATLVTIRDAHARSEFERVLRDLRAAVAAGDASRAEELDLQLTDLLFDLE